MDTATRKPWTSFSPPRLVAAAAIILGGGLFNFAQANPHYQARRWVRAEQRSFYRLERGLHKDERDARRERARLERLSKGARAFADGSGHSAHRREFALLLQHTAETPGVRPVLEETVSPLPADAFVPPPLFSALRDDGGLRPPLDSGLSALVRDRSDALYRTFSGEWRKLSQAVKQGDPVAERDIAALRETLGEWRQTVEPAAGRLRGSKRTALRAYFARIEQMLDEMEQSAAESEPAAFLQTGGFRFDGGTVAELVHHVLGHQLSIRRGGAAQTLFVGLVARMTGKAYRDIAVHEDRIEHYKAQSPAHNAALKERLIRGGFWGFWWPGAAYGSYPGAYPSTFNFPQGAMPAGLQSRAYERQIPHRGGPEE